MLRDVHNELGLLESFNPQLLEIVKPLEKQKRSRGGAAVGVGISAHPGGNSEPAPGRAWAIERTNTNLPMSRRLLFQQSLFVARKHRASLARSAAQAQRPAL